MLTLNNDSFANDNPEPYEPMTKEEWAAYEARERELQALRDQQAYDEYYNLDLDAEQAYQEQEERENHIAE
jgi:hypothetical protein